MKVVYKTKITDQIAEKVQQAEYSRQTIEKILLSSSEFDELDNELLTSRLRSSAQYLLGVKEFVDINRQEEVYGVKVVEDKSL